MLSVDSPLFREARYLLSNEPGIRDTALYHSVLGAVAAGNNSRGGIANHMERKSSDLAHPLSVLEDCQLIRRETDPIRKGAPMFRIAEPLVTFYEAVMRSAWSQLELGHAQQVWKGAQRRFSSQVLGPHFEHLCRQWTIRTEWGGELAGEVAAGIAPGNRAGANIELDAIALAPQEGDRRRRLLAIGESKWSEKVGPRHLARLRQAEEQLHNRGFDTTGTAFVLFSGTGFAADLVAEADRDERIRLVGLDTLYQSE